MSDISNRKRIVTEINNNFLVEASAGSGKTTSLVDRMVAMVESGIPVSNIVAITFTKKAANEFYERFYNRLFNRSKESYVPSKYDLLEAPTEVTRNYDKEALKNIDLCFLGTIDAFCNKVLKEHPFEAGIPSSSGIVTEKEDLIPYIENVLDKYRKDNNPVMEDIDTLFKKEDLYKLIFYGLEKREYKFNYDEEGSVEYKSKLTNFSNLLDEFKEIITFIKDLDDSLAYSQKSKLIKSNITYEYTRLMKIEPTDYKGIKSLSYLKIKDFGYPDKLGAIHIPSTISKYFIPLTGEKAKVVRVDSKKANELFDKFNYFKYIKALEFLDFIRDELYNVLKDEGRLQFIDNLIYLNNLLADKSKGQKAINSIRKRYKYYLIDEFQDTSPLQIELFFRLSSDTYKENYQDIIPNKGALFMVGDPKQSIYRFKAADFETYSNVKNRLLANNHIGEVISLTQNFRSCLSLINYFNKKFPKYLVDIPNRQTQCDEIPVDNAKADSSLSGLYVYYPHEEKLDPIYVGNMIKQIKDSDANIKYSDFMIIPNSKSAIGDYKKALSNLGIPSFAEGSIKYEGSFFEVVLNTFRFLLIRDSLSAYQLLSSKVFNIDVTTIDNVEKLEEQVFKSIPELKNIEYNSYSSLLEKLITNRFLISHAGIEGLDLLIDLLNILKDEENNGNINSNADAINKIDEVITDNEKERIALLTNDIDVVRIANTHKVKGLQAKIVILASKASRPKQARDPNCYIDHKKNEETLFKIGDPDKFNVNVIENNDLSLNKLLTLEAQYLLEENKRLLYVAATRAENTLIVNASEHSPWLDLIDSIKGCNVYKINGEPKDKIPSTNLPSDISELTGFQLINEINKEVNNASYHLVSPSDAKNISIKEIDEDEKIISNKKDAAIKGTLVHKLMECIVKSKDKKLDISRCKEIVEEYKATEYLSMLEEVYKTIYSGGYEQSNGFTSDILSEIKNSDCYYEVPFSYKLDNNVIFGYIDLLLVKDNKYTIIDYKTDKNINTDHSYQLDKYKEAIKSTLGVDCNAYIYNIKVN